MSRKANRDLRNRLAERAGFEPAVRTSRTQRFQRCSFGHSDTSPWRTHESNARTVSCQFKTHVPSTLSTLGSATHERHRSYRGAADATKRGEGNGDESFPPGARQETGSDSVLTGQRGKRRAPSFCSSGNARRSASVSRRLPSKPRALLWPRRSRPARSRYPWTGSRTRTGPGSRRP